VRTELKDEIQEVRTEVRSMNSKMDMVLAHLGLGQG